VRKDVIAGAVRLHLKSRKKRDDCVCTAIDANKWRQLVAEIELRIERYVEFCESEQATSSKTTSCKF
jgi:hypothetical protein